MEYWHWPWVSITLPQITPFCTFCKYNCLYCGNGEVRTSNLAERLIITSPSISLRAINRPQRGRGTSHMTNFNFLNINHSVVFFFAYSITHSKAVADPEILKRGGGIQSLTPCRPSALLPSSHLPSPPLPYSLLPSHASLPFLPFPFQRGSGGITPGKIFGIKDARRWVLEHFEHKINTFMNQVFWLFFFEFWETSRQSWIIWRNAKAAKL